MSGNPRSKIIALAILGALSLVCPLVEASFTGRVEAFGNFGLAEAFLSLLPMYWWYHLDKQQRGYQAGPLMNVGVIALTALALPIYFIRSRGWKKGTMAIVLAALFVAGTYALSELGEQIGLAFAS
jgi:riboflavin transporter FmnP